MALIGYESMEIAVLDDQQKVVPNKRWVIKGKTNEGATSSANITGLSREPKNSYGSNVPYYIDAKGHGDVNIDFGILDIPDEIEHEILGRDKGTDGIYYIGDATNPPECAVLLRSEDLQGNPVALGFFVGKFTRDAINLETTKKESSEIEPDSFKYQAAPKEIDGKKRTVGIAKSSETVTKLRAICFENSEEETIG